MAAETRQAKALLKSSYDFEQIKKLPVVKPGESKKGVKEVQEYLKHYGYLQAGNHCTEGTLDEVTSQALLDFQEFFHINKTGALDATTNKALATHRCGVVDKLDPLAFKLTETTWTHRNLTYAFGRLSRSVHVDDKVSKAAVKAAFQVWTDAGAGLTFNEVEKNQNPDIFIEWRNANDPDHDMRGNVLAHADFPLGSNFSSNKLPLPLHFDDEEHVWVDGAKANAFDIQTVAIHEIGHILGLHHTDVFGAIMYPSVSANHILRTLHPDDLAGIKKHYPEILPPVSQWSNLGGRIKGEVGVTSWAPGRVDLFVQGTDTAVWHKWRKDGVWSADFEYLGGSIVGSPVPVSWGPDRIDLFVAGTDHAVWHKWWNGNNWGPGITDYESLGGIIIGDPTAISRGVGLLDVFVRGTDNAVYHKWWNGSSWAPSTYDRLGGEILGGISAVSYDKNRIDLFVQGTDKGIYQKTWENGKWTPPKDEWQLLGGQALSDPVAVSWGPNRIDLFHQGTDKGLYHRWWNGKTWNPPRAAWENLGGQLNGKPSVVGWDGNQLDVFIRGLDSALYRKSWNGNDWVPSVTGYTKLGGVIDNGPTANPRGSKIQEVFARGTDNSLVTWSSALR